MKPPAWAQFVLWAVAGENQAEFVAGDLHEEFLLLCAAKGRPTGTRWYVRQVLRSATTLLGLRFRSGEAAHLVAAALVAVAMPLLLLDRLWSFVYSHIPLKDGLERAPGFWVANLVCVCVCAAICGSLAQSFPRAVGVALAGAAGAACALWCSAATAPLVYAGMVILAAPASSMAVYAWMRSAWRISR
jgi:hypothetical protein